MIYTDSIGRIHDKPTVESRPSSNNGWLYSAVARKLGHPLTIDKESAIICAVDRKRHPDRLGVKAPPISRDEILGLAELGYVDSRVTDTWNFSPYTLPKFNIFMLIVQLFQCYGQHRNYFWQNNKEQVYHVAFRVPLKDRHTLLKAQGKYNVFYHAIHTLLHLQQPKNRSSRLLRYLKTGKDIDAVKNYFGPDHPLTEIANGKE